ncbi:hypothetical protein Bbelb_229290 [Branchiostoma belcheri]|nr:hypothetical protein Bbelb_229290 [Branchiostoma belcheri]
MARRVVVQRCVLPMFGRHGAYCCVFSLWPAATLDYTTFVVQKHTVTHDNSAVLYSNQESNNSLYRGCGLTTAGASQLLRCSHLSNNAAHTTCPSPNAGTD